MHHPQSAVACTRGVQMKARMREQRGGALHVVIGVFVAPISSCVRLVAARAAAAPRFLLPRRNQPGY